MLVKRMKYNASVEKNDSSSKLLPIVLGASAVYAIYKLFIVKKGQAVGGIGQANKIKIPKSEFDKAIEEGAMKSPEYKKFVDWIDKAGIRIRIMMKDLGEKHPLVDEYSVLISEMIGAKNEILQKAAVDVTAQLQKKGYEIGNPIAVAIILVISAATTAVIAVMVTYKFTIQEGRDKENSIIEQLRNEPYYKEHPEKLQAAIDAIRTGGISDVLKYATYAALVGFAIYVGVKVLPKFTDKKKTETVVA